jgi:pyruvate/2-oxoglutarate dehydrogenase complex dihydrolipoamide dehydrogenase (E3) component
VDDVRVDLPAVVQRKDEIVLPKRAGQEQRARESDKITLIYGEAAFSGPHQVQVEGRTLAADHIFINTGTRAEVPPIAGIDAVDYLTNRSIIELQEIPEHLVILGGSYIGLEFGQMFRRFGSQVTVIEQGGRIASREDPEISERCRTSWKARACASG